MTRLYLLRHGETEWSVQGRLMGRTDIPLNARGIAQAEGIAAALGPRLPVGVRIISSPLTRAKQTAEILAASVGADVETDERLLERAYGVWEGMTMGERSMFSPSDVDQWHHGFEPRVEGYEKHASVARRVGGCLDAYGRKGDAVLVSHGSALTMAIHVALGLPPGAPAIVALNNGTWSILARTPGGGWRLEAHAVRP